MKCRSAIPAQYPRTGALLAAAAVLALAACGNEGSADEGNGEAAFTNGAPEVLTPAEARILPATERAVGRYCARVAESVSTGGGPPPAEDLERVMGQLERLAALAREKPDGAGATTTPRLALGDILENLEGSNCDNRLERGLREELAAIPSG